MDTKELVWKGQDASLAECLDEYGLVYTYDGEDFHGYCASDFDEKDGTPIGFLTFWMDNNVIDDYFKENGERIAKMCGTTPSEMDYEWKMEALFHYYGSYEFIDSYQQKVFTREEVYNVVSKNWRGNIC